MAVIVLRGAHGDSSPAELDARDETKAIADAIPGSSFVVLDGVAHLAGLENPALVNQLVEDFLAR